MGSSSLRRQAQLLAARPDLKVLPIRGNVDTRLRKLDQGEFDAIVLAVAGLTRLGWADRITEALSTDRCLPAAGQGALGIECLADNARVNELLQPLNDPAVSLCVRSERKVSAALGADCSMPLGAYARLGEDGLILRAVLGSADGRVLLRAAATHPDADSAVDSVVGNCAARGPRRCWPLPLNSSVEPRRALRGDDSVAVWVTRTEPGASTLAAALEAAGYAVLKAPVLEIRPRSFEPVRGSFDVGLFLSVHAVRFAAAEVAGEVQALFAVGSRTRSALRERGFDATVPDIETGEGLLETLADVAGKRILIVTGTGGRNLLADGLQDRGASVTRLDVYLRYPLTPVVDSGTVHLIVASSGDGSGRPSGSGARPEAIRAYRC